jgi:hypothetical protein
MWLVAPLSHDELVARPIGRRSPCTKDLRTISAVAPCSMGLALAERLLSLARQKRQPLNATALQAWHVRC